MVTYDLSDEIIAESQARADKIPDLAPDVIAENTKLEGCLGEWAALLVIGGEYRSTYDFDIFSHKEKRIEVKTQVTWGKPHIRDDDPWYCIVADKDRGMQDCDYYCFTRLLPDLSLIRVLGYIPRDELKNHPELEYWEEGTWQNGMKVVFNCWAIKLKHITAVDKPFG